MVRHNHIGDRRAVGGRCRNRHRGALDRGAGGLGGQLRQGPARWWLVAGLGIRLLTAVRWLWLMASSGHGYGPSTWAFWLVLLIGPLVLGACYLVRLLEGGDLA